MNRFEVIQSLLPVLKDELVVCNIGLPSQELYKMGDQPSNFYMLGTMGLASSIGLGLALVQEARVVAIDGDGSVLTNLGTLPTVTNDMADNFTIFIVDNGSNDSTGDQPTYAGRKTSPARVAEACGCERVVECAADQVAKALQAALDSRRMTIIVCKCDPGKIPVPVIKKHTITIRDRFLQAVLRRANG